MTWTQEQIDDALKMEAWLAWGLLHYPSNTTFKRDEEMGRLTHLTIYWL